MKKLSMCLLIVVSLFLFSCGGSESEYTDQTMTNPTDFSNVSSIIGTWESTYEVNPDETVKAKDNTREIIFNSNGSYVYYYGVYTTHGTYTFSNATATCNKEDGLGYDSGTEIFYFDPKNEYLTTVKWQEYDTIIKNTVTKYFLFKKTK